MPTFDNGDTGAAIRALLNATGNRKHNHAASARPALGDDAADGYEVGSMWVITSGAHAGEAWICLDATADAAVWSRVFGTADSVVVSDTAAITGASTIVNAIAITQAGFDAITPVSGTLYAVVPAS